MSGHRDRLRGLGGEVTLTTVETATQTPSYRVPDAHIMPRVTPYCKHGCSGQVEADLEHCFFFCVKTKEIGHWLLALLRPYDPLLTPARLLRLEMEVGREREQAVTWVVGHTLLQLWTARQSGHTTTLPVYLSRLCCEVASLELTTQRAAALIITDLLSGQ